MENKIPWDYTGKPHKTMKVQWLHEDGTTDIGIWNGKEFSTYDPAKLDVPIVAWRPLSSDDVPPFPAIEGKDLKTDLERRIENLDQLIGEEVIDKILEDK